MLKKIEDFMDVWHTLANDNDRRILFAVVERPRRFTDLMHDLRMNPRTLSEALSRLGKRGYVRKLEESTDPTKYTYSLAAKDITDGSFFKGFTEHLFSE